jgi:hypothetical protein
MTSEQRWDAFISHASEDKPFVRLLAGQLQAAGLNVWFDEAVLEVGDSLLESIWRGLAHSTYGIVVFSPSFLAKKWPREELKGLFSKEKLGEKTILPVWHGIDASAVQEYSWMIADRVAVTTEQGVPHVVRRLLRAMFPDRIDRSTWASYEFTIADLTAVILPLGPWRGSARWISKYPVLNEQYRQFLRNSGLPSQEPVGEHYVRGTDGTEGTWQGPFYPWRNPDFDRPDQPVVCVSYHDAVSFCNWVSSQVESVGSVDLPTLDLWRFAAFGMAAWPSYRQDWLSGSNSTHNLAASPAPIDMHGERTNAWGVSDLLGNVWEWCSSDTMIGIMTGFLRPVLGEKCRVGPDPVVCGGGFLDDLSKTSLFIRAAHLRDEMRTVHSDLGFRVAGTINLSVLPNEVRIHLSNLPIEDWAKWGWNGLHYPLCETG